MKRRRLTPLGVVVAVLFGLATLMLIVQRPGDPRLAVRPDGADAVTVYLVDNGFHTDLALPRWAFMADSEAAGQAARTLGPGTWVLAGWGDRSFYIQTGVSANRAADGLRALFAPSNRSVIRLTAIDRDPPHAFAAGEVTALTVSRAGLMALMRRLDGSFATPLTLTQRMGPGDVFFDSLEPFSLIHLCNDWTGELVNAAGRPTHPLIDTLPAGLRFDLTALDGSPSAP